jgi:hypothetical protein
MKAQLRWILLPIPMLCLLIFNSTLVSAQFECPPGKEWSRQTAACEQVDCPPDAGRTDTLECKCPEGTIEQFEEFTDPSTGNSYNLVRACVLPSERNPNNENSGDLSENEPSLQSSHSLDGIIHFLPDNLREPFRELSVLYRDAIPSSPIGRMDSSNNPWLSLISPGSTNNIFGEDQYACGAYQGLVLDWLERIKNSQDPGKRQLLDGFDFGPIQIAAGSHQAVVIFPSGTDWHLTGIVLDPWKEQRPEIYPLRGIGDQADWCEMFWLGLGCPAEGSVGNSLVPIGANTGHYPTTPNPNGSWQYFSGTTRRSPSTSNAENRKQVSVGSPVQVLLTAPDGRQVGILPSGEFVNDFGTSLEAHMLIAPDNTYETSFNLPDGQYRLEFNGTGSGSVHVLTRHDHSVIEQFKTILVDSGDRLTLDWQENTPVLRDQTGNVVDYSVWNKPGFDNSLILILMIGALAFACLVGITIVFVTGFFLLRRRKTKLIS